MACAVADYSISSFFFFLFSLIFSTCFLCFCFVFVFVLIFYKLFYCSNLRLPPYQIITYEFIIFTLCGFLSIFIYSKLRSNNSKKKKKKAKEKQENFGIKDERRQNNIVLSFVIELKKRKKNV